MNLESVYNWNQRVCPSVCPSVCPFVRLCVLVSVCALINMTREMVIPVNIMLDLFDSFVSSTLNYVCEIGRLQTPIT